MNGVDYDQRVDLLERELADRDRAVEELHQIIGRTRVERDEALDEVRALRDELERLAKPQGWGQPR